MSRKDSPRRTHSSDLARSMPIEVPRPPLSLITAVVRDRRGGVLVGDLDVGQRLHVDAARSSTPGSSRSRRARAAGSSGRTSRSRPRRRRRRPSCRVPCSSPALPMLSIVGLPRGRSQSPRTGRNRRAKLALRDQLLTARRPAAAGRGRRRAARDRRAPARRAGGTPRGDRRGVRLGRLASPAPARCSTRLGAAGKRVILPVLLPDDDLDWAAYARRDVAGAGRPRPARAGRRRGSGPDAVATADVVLVPGLAVVARPAMRLGRGGGSYDRALARVPVGTFTCVLLYDDEVGRRRARPSRTTGRSRRRDVGAPPPRDRLAVAVAGPGSRRERVLAGVLDRARAENAHGSVSPSAHRSVWSV